MTDADTPPDLPELLEYRGEFGAELVLFLPFVTWLSERGLLRDRRIATYRGMNCYYDDLDCKKVIYRDKGRRVIAPVRREFWMPWLPVIREHRYEGPLPHPWHRYPDLRRKFAARPLSDTLGLEGKPLLILHNKYNVEWDRWPMNFLTVEQLRMIFDTLGPLYRIVYVRHGMSPLPEGFSRDAIAIQPLEDRALLERYPEVLEFDALFEKNRSATGLDDMNDFKNRLYARSWNFISVQGGGAHHCAMFSGSRLTVLHMRGSETQMAYSRGYYRFMADPAPRLTVCQTPEAFAARIAAMAGEPPG
ncbi:hypothetical protein IAI18_12290 [Acetobacteraceae bacterium H6797]|nr:hypothetical protein [Acetobacteraceae bacterium H6797]